MSLAECTNLMSRNQYEISENQNFIGFSAAPSFVNDEAFFFSRLTDDGQVDYCKLYKMAQMIHILNLSQIMKRQMKF